MNVNSVVPLQHAGQFVLSQGKACCTRGARFLHRDFSLRIMSVGQTLKCTELATISDFVAGSDWLLSFYYYYFAATS